MIPAAVPSVPFHPSTSRLAGEGRLSPAAITGLGMAVVLLAALVLYGGYVDAGYNYADDGHYAQTAYEFLLGTAPHDIRFGYGLLWHKLGEWLFVLAGPSYVVVRGLFFATAGITAALVWLAVRQLGGGAVPAGFAALAALLVPAYPATSFYGFCTLLNVTAQLPAARRGGDLRARDVVLPALALSVTFQIRADFGYVFSMPVLAMVLHAALAAAPGHRLHRFAGLATTAIAVFLLGLLPLAGLAHRGGYLDLVLAEYLRYPKAILLIVMRLLGLDPAAAATPGAGTLLQRVPLAALREGPPHRAALALLTYGCPLAIAGFVLLEFATLPRTAAQRAARAATAFVVLVGAVATLPHYFLYRPDLPHIANFMPGFLVLSALLALRWWHTTAEGRWRGAALPGTLAVLALPLVYVWTGLAGPGTGSSAVADGRTVPFTAGNGIRVRLAPDEQALLSALRDVVLANSRPGDRIVCLPFCPGIAFLAERRLLLKEHYVDDSLLVTDPGWIERTIALTEAERPPVVVTFDWAMNGTELSRVRNWAAPYYAYLDRTATERRDVLGATVHILPAKSP